MRVRRIDRYLLLLAGLFVLAILLRRNLPGEEVLPDIYGATIHGPILAQAADAMAEPEQEIARLRSRLAAAELENRQLKELLASRQELGRFFREIEWESPPVAIPGWVTSVETDSYRRTFRLDLGQTDGIEKGMPVVTGKALLGVVSEVWRNGAMVQRVDDPRFEIEVVLALPDRYVRGILHGKGKRDFEVRFVRAARMIEPGTKVFTSSYDEKIPPGLLVGEIDEVDDAEHDGVLEVRGTPAAALGRLAQVEVLKIG